jgi:hypothetical protein
MVAENKTAKIKLTNEQKRRQKQQNTKEKAEQGVKYNNL